MIPGNIDEFDEALNKFGFQPGVKSQLFQLLAGIYCVTKIEIETREDECYVLSNDVFHLAAEYLSIEEDELKAALTTRSLQNMDVKYFLIIYIIFWFLINSNICSEQNTP